MSRRRTATGLAVAAVIAAVLAPVAGVAAAPPEVTLAPPVEKTAVKGGDTMSIEGSAEPDATLTAVVLEALDADGDLVESFDITADATLESGTLQGEAWLRCGRIPGCVEGDAAPRERTRGYRITVTVSDADGPAAATSNTVPFDEQQPSIVEYALVAPDRIRVTFDEPVFDPEREDPTEWRIDGQTGRVLEISGSGAQRQLVLLSPVASGVTPQVHYIPHRDDLDPTTNYPYLDGAYNYLRGEGRLGTAAIRIPPPIPTIAELAGQATGGGQILGNDATPTVVVGEMEPDTTATVYVAEGDQPDPAGDRVLGQADAQDGTATVQAATLADGVHRIYATATNHVACDPDDASAGTCHNESGPSSAVTYDLDTVVPAPATSTFTATSSRIVVELTEAVSGPNAPADWSVVGSSATVTGVEGSGESRTLTVDGLVADDQLRYAPGDERYVDPHGNGLADFTVRLELAPLPVVSVLAEDATEGDPDSGLLGADPSTVVFTVELSEPVAEGEDDATVAYRTQDGSATAGEDYTATSGTITFPADGATTTGTIEVEVTPNTLYQRDRTLDLVLDQPAGVTLPGGQVERTGTILDDDPMPTVVVDVQGVDEGDELRFPVTLSTVSGVDAQVAYRLGGATATLGQDLADARGTLIIPAGSSAASIDIRAIADGIDEDVERATLELSQPVDAGFPDDAATIAADVHVYDLDPAPSATAADVRVTESSTRRTIDVPVRLSAASSREIEVSYDTVNGSAVAGRDFQAARGTITIPPGAHVAEVPVTLLGYTAPDSSRSFRLALTGAEHASIEDGDGTITITDTSVGSSGSSSGGSTSGGSSGNRAAGTSGDSDSHPGADDGTAGPDTGMVTDLLDPGTRDAGGGISPGPGPDGVLAAPAGDDRPDLPRTGGGMAALGMLALLGAAGIRRRHRA